MFFWVACRFKNGLACVYHFHRETEKLEKEGDLDRCKRLMGLALVGALSSQVAALDAFGQGLSLEEAIAIALKDNTAIRAAEQQVIGAESEIRAARSNYLPTMNVSHQYLKLDGDALFINLVGAAIVDAIVQDPAEKGAAIERLPDEVDISDNNTTNLTSLQVTEVLYSGGDTRPRSVPRMCRTGSPSRISPNNG